jgi:hypothetical protein
MTDEEDRLRRLRAALRDIHWSAEAMASATGLRSETAHRIVAGRWRIGDWLLVWLEKLAELHRQNPPPPPPPSSGQGDG